MKKRKGFTLVELLVVIAILAILATVSIVGYTSFIKKANVSNDNTLVAELNTFVQVANVDGSIKTPTDAAEVLEEEGFYLNKLEPSTDGYRYGYDVVAHKFCLLDADYNAIDYTADAKVNVFVFVKTLSELEAAEAKGYSAYLQYGFNATEVATSKGVDTGVNSVDIAYTNSTKQDVVFCTNGGTLTIKDTTGGKQYHYGDANKVDVTTGTTCYHELGEVDVLIARAGVVNIDSGADVAILACDKNNTTITKANDINIALERTTDNDTNIDSLVSTINTYKAMVGNVAYSSLKDAYDAALPGATITLLNDVELSQYISIRKDIKIILNGYTLTSTAFTRNIAWVFCGATLTVDGTKPGSTVYGSLMAGWKKQENFGAGNIVINGGTYKNDIYTPIYVNGEVKEETCNLSISDATIIAEMASNPDLEDNNSKSDKGFGLYLAGNNNTVIKNCTITAVNTGLEIRAGKLEIENCIITGNSDPASYKANGSGATLYGVAIGVDQHSTKLPINLTVKSGTFTGEYGLYEKCTCDSPNYGVISISVLGGNFVSTKTDAIKIEDVSSIKAYSASGYTAIGAVTANK